MRATTSRNWKEELKQRIKKGVDDAVSTSNTAVASNIGKKGGRTSVSSRQRVVHKDGRTTTYEERTERSDS